VRVRATSPKPATGPSSPPPGPTPATARPSPQPASGGLHLAEWGSELLGTAVFVLAGLSALALNFSPGSPVPRLVPSTSARFFFLGALFNGAAGVVAVSPLGRRSGGHLNPAVTLALWVAGRVHRHVPSLRPVVPARQSPTSTSRGQVSVTGARRRSLGTRPR
jgi:Major intrinsic protein